MKLFTRYTRWNTLAMLAVFVLGAGALFFSFRYILIQQVDENLEVERDEQMQYIRMHGKLPETVNVEDLIIEFRAVSFSQKERISTVTRMDDGNEERFRQISFPVALTSGNYQCLISSPLEATEHLLRLVALVTLATIALMLTAIYIINRGLVKYLLRPFYSTVNAVHAYSLSHQAALELGPTPIEEFTVLNQALNDMTARGLNDYRAMRDFSANAAHEMQTPLAVIRTKVETLMQSAGLSEEQATQIAGIDNSLERLTRLFNSLLLLTKIEHHQFPVSETLNLDEIVAERIQELQEIVQDRNIAIHSDLKEVSIHCNRYLIEVLVSNLLNNAIRYNYSGGGIHIVLRQNSLVIANTSMLPQLDPEAIFRPFYRHSDSRVDGNGLGLSIVRQICDTCGFSVEYAFAEAAHRFSVYFPG